MKTNYWLYATLDWIFFFSHAIVLVANLNLPEVGGISLASRFQALGQ